MSTLQTFRFWFEPDREISQFKRLNWELVDVSINDVMMNGIHPWMGLDRCYSLLDKFFQQFNREDVKLEELIPMGLSHDVLADNGNYWQQTCRFHRALTSIRENVYFVDALGYLELLRIAKERIRDRWCHNQAKVLSEKAYYGFHELRRFLKAKNTRLKLSSYSDLDRYDLGREVSLEDFEHHDRLLISEGIPSSNFRATSWLEQITDQQGRLRLMPEIRAVSLATIMKSEKPNICGTHVQWHVTRSGTRLVFRPDVGGSISKRDAAKEFALRWRSDDGRLVFQSDMGKLPEILAKENASPTFPSLNYTARPSNTSASAEVQPSRIRAYQVGHYPTDKCTGEVLRGFLCDFGCSTSGTKETMIDRLAALAERLYAQHTPELNQHFSEHRYTRILVSRAAASEFPVLADTGTMRNLLMAMYVLRHLRGNTILEAQHENTTYSPRDLAQALLTNKLSLEGVFVSAV